ncbi:MAG: hypothetical protein P1U56_02240 [Saprospiraceae bacterium]|nr:hypothetical protein [Saprospiraceae bacterium]
MGAQKGEILCIHYYFPPLDSTATIRNYYVAKTLTEFYDKVHVFTSNNHLRFPSLQKEFPSNLYCTDIPTFDYRIVLSGKSKKDAHITTGKKKGRLYKFALKIQKSFPFNLFLAEGNLIYIIRAYLKAKKLIKSGQVKAIYSSFGPYCDHYVAYLLKRKYPKLRWIADFRDLQIEPIYKNVIWKNFQQRIEQSVLNKVDLITCISHGFVEQLKVYNRPTVALLRGVEVRQTHVQFNKFTIAYTGSLYFEYRDPRPMFQVVAQLLKEGSIDPNTFEIVYAGRDGIKFYEWIKEYQLEKNFANWGLVSQTEAKQIQNQSHINLLLTSSSPELTGVITGKVFEYFEALNPTLCLINGVYDPEFESLFRELNAGVVVYNPEQTKGKMRKFILSKYEEWRTTHRVASTINSQIIQEKYSWKHQVSKMVTNNDTNS